MVAAFGSAIGQDHGSFFRCQTAPWKYSYMLGGMVSLCSLAMCLRTASEYWKRSPQIRQCHWSPPKMYGRHSELFGSSLGSGILISSLEELYTNSEDREVEIEFPKHAFTVFPISNVFECVTNKLVELLNTTKR